MISVLTALVISSTAAPAIDVYTFGPGDEIFSHFGHSAICAGDRCYNYGTADFSTPVPLTIDFIRGRALFWVSVIDRERMKAAYRREDRSIWRQTLPLTEQQASDLARSLATAVESDERYYRYHHYRDNCTTRIRDLVDRVTGGALSKAKLEERPTFREYTYRGFAGHMELLAVTDLIMGRAADQPGTRWDAMFLPAELMSGLHEHLGAAPVLEYERRGPPFEGSRYGGRFLFGAIGAVLALLLLISRGRLFGFSRRFVGFVLALIALVPWGLAVASAFPELSENEVLLVLLPLDLALVVLSAARARTYVFARLIGLAVVLVASLLGVLMQPLWPAMLICAPPLFVAWMKLRPNVSAPTSAR